MSINSKKKGNAYELQVVNKLKDLGYQAVSARAESKNLDDLGCDIVTDAPFSIQCKASERLSMPTHDLLRAMHKNGLERPVVFHKRNNKGTVVSMRYEDFEALLLAKNS